MFWDTLFGLIALLNGLGFLLLAGLVLFIALKGSRRTRSRARLRCTFSLLALSLLFWQLTLFLEVRTALPALQLGLGRLNFAVIVFTAYLAVRFVLEVPLTGTHQASSLSPWLLAETVLLALLTLLTPLVDAAERVEAGHALTTFGLLFPYYLSHVMTYFAAALALAFWERSQSQDPAVRGQLMLIGLGMLATGGIAFLTNALLPYCFGDFRFCDLGTLSTLFFVLAIAYATFIHRLFDLRVVLRETLVYGLLLTFILGAYSSSVFLVTQYLANGAGKLTQFAVLLIAFSVDPLRRFLEKKTDALLFGKSEADDERTNRRRDRQRRYTGGRLALALLFPWRRP